MASIGSEGRLAFPYQRVGMVTALQELSSALEGKYLNKISPNICNFLLSCYKDDGESLNCYLLCLCSLIIWLNLYIRETLLVLRLNHIAVF